MKLKPTASCRATLPDGRTLLTVALRPGAEERLRAGDRLMITIPGAPEVILHISMNDLEEDALIGQIAHLVHTLATAETPQPLPAFSSPIMLKG